MRYGLKKAGGLFFVLAAPAFFFAISAHASSSSRCRPAVFKDEPISKIFRSAGSPKPEYIGIEGYARFADRHYAGKMQTAFKNVSAVSGKEEMAELGWKNFRGTVSQFHALKRGFTENYPNGWMELEGQERVADRICEGSKQTAYMNVSVLRGYFFGGGTKNQNRLFRDLKWSGIGDSPP